MEFNIEIKGLDALVKKLRALGDVNLEPLFEMTRANMWNRSNKNGAAGGGTPYLSGDLKKSRHSRSSKKEARLGYNAEHAPHVEFGHRTKSGGFVKGQYFLKSNFEQQKKVFKNDIQRILKEAK